MKGSDDPQAQHTTGAASGPGREPSISELRALADHARQRLALYQRRMSLGRGDPARFAEHQRIADGAAGRLKRALARARSTPIATDADAPASSRPQALERQGEP